MGVWEVEGVMHNGSWSSEYKGRRGISSCGRKSMEGGVWRCQSVLKRKSL